MLMAETILMALKEKEKEEQKRFYDGSHVTQSGEDYLEAVLILQKKNGMVRSVDLAQHMDFGKPSIDNAASVLQDGGFLIVDENGFIHLTDIGRTIAEKIYERRQFFTEQLIAAGVDQETAEQDACRIEHAISDKSFQKLKDKAQQTD